jgi:F420-non-reducing hydrogenase iron-sulfur subunit
MAPAERSGYDPSVRVIRLMCAGRIHKGLILRAFARGAARVLVLACGHEHDHTGNGSNSLCSYHTGNHQARNSVEQAQQLLKLLGIAPTRLALAEMQPGDGSGFVEAVEEFIGSTGVVVPKG